MPAKALIDLRSLSLLGMIARIGPSCPLFSHALFVVDNNIPVSWFKRLQNTCIEYSLPDIKYLLLNPLPKSNFKALIKKSVTAFWHQKLCNDVRNLPSLKFLRPAFLSLGGLPHLIWESCGSSPSAIRSATIQARLLSGRYRTDLLTSKYSGECGSCSIPGCLKWPADETHI